MGPPGVGKGTQAKILSKSLDVKHISTGEILRNEIQMDTKIGKIAKSFIDHGNFVPDKLVLDIISEKVCIKIPSEGYLFDGFPRTIPQATGFDKLLIDIKLTTTTMHERRTLDCVRAVCHGALGMWPKHDVGNAFTLSSIHCFTMST